MEEASSCSQDPHGVGDHQTDENDETQMSDEAAEDEEYDAFDIETVLPAHRSVKSLHIVFVIDTSSSMGRYDVGGTEERRIDAILNNCYDLVKAQGADNNT